MSGSPDDGVPTVWPQMPQWRPIASAPRDGTIVLLFDPREHIGIGIGSWVAGTREIWERVDERTKTLTCVEDAGYWNASSGDSYGLGSETITHWMPLPAAPQPAVSPHEVSAQDDPL